MDMPSEGNALGSPEFRGAHWQGGVSRPKAYAKGEFNFELPAENLAPSPEGNV